jgi:hypothetical protein
LAQIELQIGVRWWTAAVLEVLALLMALGMLGDADRGIAWLVRHGTYVRRRQKI